MHALLLGNLLTSSQSSQAREHASKGVTLHHVFALSRHHLVENNICVTPVFLVLLVLALQSQMISLKSSDFILMVSSCAMHMGNRFVRLKQESWGGKIKNLKLNKIHSGLCAWLYIESVSPHWLTCVLQKQTRNARNFISGTVGRFKYGQVLACPGPVPTGRGGGGG